MPSERTIFIDALELPPGAPREVFLDKACGGDQELRRRVEALLEAHQSPQERLARLGFDAVDEQAASRQSPDCPFESIGDTIGPYKLLQQIGEGGFGVVFLAEQRQPVRRRVALKIIKPGMDTRQVIGRFEAERQALAMMEHPNIAKVLEAGATESGRSYFVMELVQGVPITDYCDKCNLTTGERLRLFVNVCQAVQHAHQKGVIHRDIKPSNVMIAFQDGNPTPKIIDFGVAKAINQRLTEHTVMTAYSQMVGTPLYMSPEQAELSPLDVDTRSDIYSLGVVLYELLTGTTPLDKERLKAAPYDELRRLIREEDPPRPSARLSTLDAELATTVADHRRTDVRRLLQTVRGDLDWIVMKCVDKDRNRRYETANGLARDIERYLDDEPVQACPPSAAYRFGKFARRNKGMLAAAAAIMALLLLLIVGLAVSNRLIAAERNQKAAALEEKEQALARAELERQRAEANFRRARISVRGILSDAARGIGEWSELSPQLREKFAQETVNYYESFLQEASADPSLQYETAVGYRSLAVMFNSMGDEQKGEQFFRRSIAILEQLAEAFPSDANYRHQLAFTQYALGLRLRRVEQWDDAAQALQTAAELYWALIADDADNGDYYLELAVCYRVLIRTQDTQGAIHESHDSARRLVDLLRRAAALSPQISEPEMFWRLELVPKAPPASPVVPDVAIGISEALINVGRLDVAVTACREIAAESPNDAAAHYRLAHVLELSGQFSEAIAHLERAVALREDFADAHNGLAWLLSTCPEQQLRDAERAQVAATQAVELISNSGAFRTVLGAAHYRAGEFAAANNTLQDALELDAAKGPALFVLAMAQWRLGDEQAAQEYMQQAATWTAENRPKDKTLIRLRGEASQLLGATE